MENPGFVTISVYGHGGLRLCEGVSVILTVSDYLQCLAFSVRYTKILALQ